MARLALCAFVVLLSSFALPAEAQLHRGSFRFSIDADMLSIAGVELDPDGPRNDQDATLYGIGPNQLGGARAWTSTLPTPLGLGFGWGLGPKLLLGGRVAFGLDVVDNDDGGDNTRYLGLALEPGLTWVPIGHKAKLFVSGNPLFQVSRAKYDNGKERMLFGGVDLGIGTLIFVTGALSVDLGFHFVARFGRFQDDADNGADVRDLRGVVRLGLSLWT